ncbi:hypothetical protein ACVWXM_008663 [Bradyrhizobium sp. GM7.3]
MEASAVAHDVLIRPVQKSWRMHLRKPIALPKLHVVLAIFARLDVSPLAVIRLAILDAD